MSKKLLITGSSGFIGGFLVEAAIARGYEVYAGLRKTSSKKYLTNPETKFLVMEFENEELLRKQLVEHKFDYIIHNAGVTKTKKEETYLKINAGYLQSMVDILSSENVVPTNFIYMSSIAARGPADYTETGLVTNDTPPQPVTNYGKSKLAGERILEATTNFSYTIIRPTIVYGPREKDLYTVFELVKKGLELYVGSHKQSLTFIHVKDLVQVIIDALSTTRKRAAYFVADGDVYSSEELNGFIKEALGKKTMKLRLPIGLIKVVAAISESVNGIFGNYPPLNRDKVNELKCQSWVIDTSLIQEDFNFAPRIRLPDGIRDTVKWYKQNNWL
jgi:nucleoside-diphosphate-sugar epimerase